jgi:hypothetical protein
MSKKTYGILGILTIIGIAYRLFLASFYIHEPMGDEYLYLDFAKLIHSQFLVSYCCSKSYGYPLFLSLFSTSTVSNLPLIIFVQAVMDSMTAVLIFILSKRILHNNRYAYLSYIIYLLNPVTASLVRLFLSEVLGIFLITLTLIVYVNKDTCFKAFSFGILLGYFAFVRVNLLYWSIGILILYVFTLIVKKRFKIQALLAICGFLLPTIYPIVSNWKLDNRISLTPRTSSFLTSFLVSTKVEDWPQGPTDPTLLRFEKEWSPSAGETMEQFTQRKLIPDFNNALIDIKNHPFSFLLSRLRINLNLWNKSNMYYFYDPFEKYDRPLLIILNIFLLIFSALGVLKMTVSKVKTRVVTNILLFFYSIFIYTTITLSFKVAEQRYTLPVYPILIVFFPLGISWFLSQLVIYFKIIQSSMTRASNLLF